MVIRMDHQMDKHVDIHVDIHVVIKNGHVWIRLWLSGQLWISQGDLLGVNLDMLDIHLDIQFGYPRYPNSRNISVEIIR
jgi:hypothetical protein